MILTILFYDRNFSDNAPARNTQSHYPPLFLFGGSLATSLTASPPSGEQRM